MKRLKSICANNNDEIDQALFSAIKIGRAVDRRTLVRQVVTRLCSSCNKAKKECQSLRKANRAVKDQIRKLKLTQEAKKRNGFKVKTNSLQRQKNSN